MNLLDQLRQLCGYGFPPMGRRLQAAVVSRCPQTIRTTLHPGIAVTLDLRDETQRSTWWRGMRFEYPTGQTLCAWSSDSDSVFFDIGSNYGFFSLMLLSRNPHLRVHAFEPNPRTFAHLTRTKTENGLDRLTLWNLGVSDGSGTLSLRCGKADSGHSTFGEHPGLDPNGSVMVDVVPFDDWVSRQGLALPSSPKWVVKIDVEGFELRVLRGMQAALNARAFSGLVVEINPFTLNLTGDKPSEIHDFLVSCGYRLKAGCTFPDDGNAFFEPKP